MASEHERLVSGWLAAFLPRMLLERIASRGGVPREPGSHDFDGALATIDISGFTRLTERLAPRGSRGAEELSDLLNRFYGRLAFLGDEWGGDITAFAGDAALLVWPAQLWGGLRDATRRAAAFALHAQKELAGIDAGAGVRLRIHASIGAGSFRSYELGGVDGQWLHLLGGDPLDQVAGADEAARPGEVLLSANASRLLGSDARLDPRQGESARLLALRASPERARRPDPPQCSPGDMSAFVPEVVSARLRAGQRDFIAEFRRVSVLFVRLHLSDAAELRSLQEATSTFQRLVLRYEGAVYQCLRDDKGFIAIAAFGIPPRSHEDDPARACLAAAEFAGKLRELSHSSAIGIATGRLFCGDHGNARRRQYAMVGPTINLAARLMQAAGRGQVLADEVTQQEAHERIHFGEGRELRVKGLDQPLIAAEPLGRRGGAPAMPASQMHRPVGREREMEALAKRVDLLVQGKRPGPLLIMADAGMGKSTLVSAVSAHAISVGARVLLAHADSIEAASPYFAFRALFADLLASQDPSSESAWLSGARALVGDAPELTGLLPLLSVVAPLVIADNPITQKLEGASRAAHTLRLLSGLIAAAARRQPLVLTVEDGHWLDSASWNLLVQVARSGEPLAILATSRPTESSAVRWSEIGSVDGAAVFDLAALDADALGQVVARELDCDELPPQLEQLLFERAEGNPFHAEEIALSLLERDFIVVEDGKCRIASDRALDDLELPPTVERVITDRVDRLPTESQLTLKVGSVIGRFFETDLLIEVHPLESQRPEIPGHLLTLSSANLIDTEGDSESGQTQTSRFRHAVIHETVYGMLAFMQRATLHRQAVLRLQQRHAGALDPVYPRLAYHYERAGMREEALVALRRSGEIALEAYALEEAVAFFERALALDAKAPEGLSTYEEMRIRQLLAEAYFSLSRYEEVREHGNAVLRAGGFRTVGPATGLARELGTWAVQGLRVWLGLRRAKRLSGEALDECVCAMNTLGNVIGALRFEGRDRDALHGLLLIYNLSARIEPASEVGPTRAAYARLMVALGFRRAGLHRARLAIEEALAFDDPVHQLIATEALAQILSMIGRPVEALAHFRVAVDQAESEGTGLWRHRPLYDLGENLLFVGGFDEAEAVLLRAAEISEDAEPQVTGLMRALAAVARLRLGDEEEAREGLQRGVADSRRHPGPLPLYASLGALAEAQVRTGRYENALSSAQDAERVAAGAGGLSSWVTGLHGLHGVAYAYLGIWDRLRSGQAAEGSQIGLGESDLRQAVARSCRSFKSFVRVYPVAEPRYLLLGAWRRRLLGQPRRARRNLARAERLAEQMGLPYEHGVALRMQAEMSKSDREGLLRRASAIFEEHGLRSELARCQTILQGREP